VFHHLYNIISFGESNSWPSFAEMLALSSPETYLHTANVLDNLVNCQNNSFGKVNPADGIIATTYKETTTTYSTLKSFP